MEGCTVGRLEARCPAGAPHVEAEEPPCRRREEEGSAGRRCLLEALGGSPPRAVSGDEDVVTGGRAQVLQVVVVPGDPAGQAALGRLLQAPQPRAVRAVHLAAVPAGGGGGVAATTKQGRAAQPSAAWRTNAASWSSVKPP